MFKTIKENIDIKSGGALLEIRKSKFISYAYYIESEADAEEILNNIKEEHKTARHIAYALNVSENMEITKYSDAGEPAKTAGFPIYNIIIEKQLKNILLVVVRYFGGILLGTGGLVRAYTNSALEALKKAGVKYKSKGIVFKLKIGYADLDILKTAITNINKSKLESYDILQIIDIMYLENIEIILFVSYAFFKDKNEEEFAKKTYHIAKELKTEEQVLNTFLNLGIKIEDIEKLEEDVR